MKVEVAKEPGPTAPKAHVAGDLHIELALRVDEEASTDLRNTEEVETDTDLDRPVSLTVLLTHLDTEAGIELENLDEFHLSAQGKSKGIGRHIQGSQGVLYIRGVDFQRSTRIEGKNGRLRSGPDLESQGYSSLVDACGRIIEVDPGPAGGRETEGAKVESDVEIHFEAKGSHRDLHKPAGGRKPEELHRSVQAKTESWLDGITRSECLVTTGGVEFKYGRNVELQPDLPPKAYIEGHIETGNQALGIDPEPAVREREHAERRERQLAIDNQFNTRVVPRQLKAELHHAGNLKKFCNPDRPREEEAETACGFNCDISGD